MNESGRASGRTRRGGRQAGDAADARVMVEDEYRALIAVGRLVRPARAELPVLIDFVPDHSRVPQPGRYVMTLHGAPVHGRLRMDPGHTPTRMELVVDDATRADAAPRADALARAGHRPLRP